MDKHSFTITISGTQSEATAKVQALATMATYLDLTLLKKLAEVAKTDPAKVALAKQFLGV